MGLLTTACPSPFLHWHQPICLNNFPLIFFRCNIKSARLPSYRSIDQTGRLLFRLSQKPLSKSALRDLFFSIWYHITMNAVLELWKLRGRGIFCVNKRKLLLNNYYCTLTVPPRNGLRWLNPRLAVIVLSTLNSFTCLTPYIYPFIIITLHHGRPTVCFDFF